MKPEEVTALHARLLSGEIDVVRILTADATVVGFLYAGEVVWQIERNETPHA